MCHTEQTHYKACDHWVRTIKLCPNQDIHRPRERTIYLKQCGFSVLPDLEREGYCPHCSSPGFHESHTSTYVPLSQASHRSPSVYSQSSGWPSPASESWQSMTPTDPSSTSPRSPRIPVDLRLPFRERFASSPATSPSSTTYAARGSPPAPIFRDVDYNGPSSYAPVEPSVTNNDPGAPRQKDRQHRPTPLNLSKEPQNVHAALPGPEQWRSSPDRKNRPPAPSPIASPHNIPIDYQLQALHPVQYPLDPHPTSPSPFAQALRASQQRPTHIDSPPESPHGGRRSSSPSPTPNTSTESPDNDRADAIGFAFNEMAEYHEARGRHMSAHQASAMLDAAVATRGRGGANNQRRLSMDNQRCPKYQHGNYRMLEYEDDDEGNGVC